MPPSCKIVSLFLKRLIRAYDGKSEKGSFKFISQFVCLKWLIVQPLDRSIDCIHVDVSTKRPIRRDPQCCGVLLYIKEPKQ